MVTPLGEYKSIKIFHDSDIHDEKIVFGNAKKKKYKRGIVKPLDIYKKSISKEPIISKNEDFRSIHEKYFENSFKVKWIIGGTKEIIIYKEAIEFIYKNFKIKI